MPDLSTRIRELRRQWRMNQLQFGRQVGVSQGTVSKWEKGVQQPDDNALQILIKMSGEDWQTWMGSEPPDASGTTASVRTLAVEGFLQKHLFRKSPEWPAEQIYHISVPLPDDCSDEQLKAYEIRGEFVNKVYPSGSIVIIRKDFKYEDFQDRGFVAAEVEYIDGTRDFSAWACTYFEDELILSSSSIDWFKRERLFVGQSEVHGENVKACRILGMVIGSYRMDRRVSPTWASRFDGE